MADGVPTITRGTTPSITVVVPMDLTGYSCYLSVGKRARHPWLTADNEQMEAECGEESSTLVFTLTQEQTLACDPGKAYVQLRLIEGDTAVASEMAEVRIADVIKDGEITDEY